MTVILTLDDTCYYVVCAYRDLNTIFKTHIWLEIRDEATSLLKDFPPTNVSGECFNFRTVSDDEAESFDGPMFGYVAKPMSIAQHVTNSFANNDPDSHVRVSRIH